ncbi:hypothetical protein HDU87_007758 [Geranomyces variabilis]|uniref:Uncharacterized protein n=1 Tax=Geranomyces variabilis TaxID=109894 RepID=A0AAD5TES0_9FUNG|nr:hypothetical protein HDU87_007758 [Geranomyces variabilis]
METIAHYNNDAEFTHHITLNGPQDPEDPPPTKKSLNKRSSRRYCGARLSRRQYFCVWILGVSLVLSLVLSLLAYFVIAPAIIKNTFATAQLGGSDKVVTVQDVNVKSFSNTGVALGLAAGVSGTKLPVSFLSGGIEPATFFVNDAASAQNILSVSLSNAISLDGKSDLQFNQDALALNFSDGAQARDIVNKILVASQSTSNASIPLDVVITGKASFNLAGIVIKDVDLKRSQTIDLLTFAQMARKLLPLSAGGANSTGPVSASVTRGPTPSSVTVNTNLSKRATATNSTGASATITLGTLQIVVNDNLISAAVGGSFVASQPITVSLGPLSFMTVLQSQDLAGVTVSGLSLSKAENSFAAKVDVAPVAAQNPAALTQITQTLLQGGSADGISVGVRNFSIANVNGTPIPWLNTILSAVSINADLGGLQQNLVPAGTGGAYASTSSLSDIIKIQGLDVQLGANNTISINPAIKVKSPIAADLSVAAISGQISANKGTQVVAFQLPAFSINGTQEQSLNFPVTLTLGSSADAQAAASQIANALLGGQSTTLQLGGLQVGAKSARLNNLLGILSIPVPLSGLNLAAPSTPAISSRDSAGSNVLSNFNLQNATFALTEAGFNLGLDAAFTQSLPVNVKIPFLNVRLGVDSSDLIGLNVNGLGVTQGPQALALAVNGTVATDPAIGDKLASIVNSINNEQGSASALVLQGIQFGGSANNPFTLFNGLNATIPTSLLKAFASSGTPILGNVGPAARGLTTAFNNASVLSANVSATADGLAVGAGAGVNVTLPVSVSAPFLGFDVLNSGNRLVSVSVTGVAFQPGQNTLNLALSTKFANGTAAQSSAGDLASAIISGNTANASIAVSGFKFGVTEAKSIGTFSSLKISVPASLLSGSAAGTGAPSLLTFFPSASALSLGAINPQIRSLKVAAVENGLNVSPSVSLMNPLPVSVSIPFVGLTVALNGQQLTSSTLSGLSFGSGPASLDLALANAFGSDAALPDSVKQLFDDISAGRTPSTAVSVTGLTFGISAGTSISTLSAIKVNVPLGAFLSGNATMVSGGLSLASLFPNATLSLDTVNPQVKLVNITALANGLSIAPSAAFNNPLPISIAIPFIGFATSVKDTQLLSSKLQGLTLEAGQNTLSADLASTFGTDAGLAANVKSLVDSFVAGQLGQLGLSVSGLRFGASEQSSIGLLSKVVAALPVPSLNQTTTASLGPSLVTRLFPTLGNLTLASFAPVLRKADVTSTAVGFDLNVDAGLTNPVPVSVNLGHFATDVSLPSAKLVGVSLSNLALGVGQTTLAPSVNLAFGRDAALASDINAGLAAARAGGSAQLTVGNLTFGSDAQNAVTAFSQIAVPLTLPLAGLAALASGNSTGAAATTTTALPVALGEIKSASFATTDSGVKLGASANIVNSSPLALKLGFVSVGLTAQSGAKLAQVSLSNFTLAAGASLFGLQLDAALENGPGASQGVAGIFNSVMQSQPSAVRISNIRFGDSEANAFDFLKSVDQSVPIPAGAIGGSGNSTTSIIPAISLVNTDFATTADGVSATLQAAVGATAFPISIDLGFASAGVLLNSTKLASFSTNGVRVAGGNVVVVPVALAMLPMDAAVPALVAGIVNPVLAGGTPRAFSVGANQLVFGSSQAKTFDIFSGINFSIPVPAALINGTTTAGGGGANTFALPTLVNPTVATTAQGFAAAIQAKFVKALPLTANIGFANASISLDDTLVTSFGIGKTSLDKAGGLTTSADVRLETSETAQNKVAAIANPIVAQLLSSNGTAATPPTGNVRISGLTFGGEGAAANPLLSQIVLSVPLAKLAGLVSPASAAAPAAGGNTDQSLPLNASVALALVPTGVAGSISIPPITAMPLTLDIGNLNATIASNGASFSKIGVSQIRLAPSATGSLAVDVQLAVSPNVYPPLVTDFLAAKPVTVNVGGLTFGQAGSPLSLFSKILAPLTLTKGALPAPKLNLIPPAATFAFTSGLPLTFDAGTLSVDAMLGKSRAATLSVANLAVKKGANSVKAGISLSFLGGITGLPQLLFGAGVSAANVKVASSTGQDITWITQSFAGKQVALDLASLLGKGAGATTGKFARDGGDLSSSSPLAARLLAEFDWSEESRSTLLTATAAELEDLVRMPIIPVEA